MQAGGPGGHLRLFAGVFAAASLCTAAYAQDTPAPSDPASAMIGTWEFSNADRDKVCRFVFRKDVVPSGHKLEVDKSCPNLFPATKDIVAWAVDSFGSLRLLDSAGNPAIELSEAEVGLYDGFEPGQGRYVLQIVVTAPPRSAEDQVGDWAITRGAGKPICMLTLANAPSGTDALALKIKPGCDTFVSRFAPVSWRMDQGELLLLSVRGQTWRFEANDANTWQRVPDTADPVLLLRQQ